MFLLISVAVCGCANNRDWSGQWQPINRLDEVPQALRLQPLLEYHAAPVDRTLKGVLKRWAHEAGMTLDWRLPQDYTLTKPITTVRAEHLADALQRLGAAYADQQISLSLVPGRIVVSRRADEAEKAMP